MNNLEALIKDEENLDDEQQKQIYGYAALEGIPGAMAAWEMGFHPSHGSKYGRYVLVDVRPATIELHHQVQVIDESGWPLRGVWTVFGFDTGKKLNVQASKIAWIQHPQPIGNPQQTNAMGYAQHTVGSGGENIYLWAIEDEVLLPSPMVTNCTWVDTSAPGAAFIHTGVILTFQRRLAHVIPQKMYQAKLEARILALEEAQAQLAEVAQLPTAVETLEQKISRIELDIAFIKGAVIDASTG